MTDPVLVEVLRGDHVESRHHGVFVICDAAGAVVASAGDVEARVFPRSAVKALQALPLIESGAAERYGLTAEELALACASHSGEPRHTALAAQLLAKAGREETCLECGAHWPISETASRELAAAGRKPSALHNNCSGKHAGFVCLACSLGVDPKSYVSADHRVQREVKAALEGVTGDRLDISGTDGCSIPTYAIGLRALARGFARFASGEGLAPDRARAARQLHQAVAAHPFLVAGTGRFDTAVMEVLRERAFTKTGAEGVFCAALPEKGLGVAIKCADGASRAAETIMAHVLDRYLPLTAAERELLAARLSPRLTNWNGIEVGRIRIHPELARR